MSETALIHLTCPACGTLMTSPRESIGTTVGCPNCHGPVAVQDPALPAPLIVDARRKIGLSPRGGPATTDSGFKDRFQRTTESTFKVDPENPVMKRRDHRKQKHGGAIVEWDNQTLRPPRDHRRSQRRIVRFLAWTTALLAVAAAVLFWHQLKNAPDVKVDLRPSERPLEIQASSDFRDKVWQAVRNFAAAGTPRDLLPFVRDPDRVGPHIGKFYNSENPLVPLSLAAQPDLPELEVHNNFVVFDLSLSDFSKRPIALEQTPDGFLVDWESFTGYSELPWRELRRTRPRTPILVRAIMRRSDYFNQDFPAAGTHVCYQINNFHADQVLYAYVPVDSPLLTRVREVLGGAPSVHAVIRVRYPENSTNDRQVEITEVVAKGWVFREDAGLPAPGEPAPEDSLSLPVQSSPGEIRTRAAVLPGLKP